MRELSLAEREPGSFLFADHAIWHEQCFNSPFVGNVGADPIVPAIGTATVPLLIISSRGSERPIAVLARGPR
jgi:hypothetical protein